MTLMTLLPLLGSLLCAAGGIGIFCISRFQVKLIALAGIYLGGSLVMLNTGSFQMCAALLICGIGCTVLIGTCQHDPNARESDETRRVNLVFRLLLALGLAVLAYTSSEHLRLWIPIRRNVLIISLWLCLMSIVGLSLDDDLFPRCIHMQSVCLAFTLSYIYMESSILVFACFAAINLLMAFGCAVLTNDRYTEHREEAGQ